MKFRKRPVVIEAFQYLGDRISVMDWAEQVSDGNGTSLAWLSNGVDYQLVVNTLEGQMKADFGDWIICGVNGEFYFCKPDIFEKSYERAE